MNIQEYISSGVLESYALGTISDAERKEVEVMISKYPELRNELSLIEETMEAWAISNAVTPPSHIKLNILKHIENNSNQTKVISMNNAGATNLKWLVAASVTLLIGSAAFNVVLFNKYSDAKGQIAQLENANSVLAQDLNVNKASFEKAQSELAVVSSPDIQIIQMNNPTGTGSEKATIFWDKKNKEVFLAVNALPNPPENKQYQLWAIVDGVPVDAGVFNVSNNEGALQKMKGFESAQAFAVTVEKMGGSPSPDLTTLTVIANV